jgi:hypothetical protein
MSELIVGGVIAIISGAIGTAFGASLKSRRWLRDQRREAYTRCAALAVSSWNEHATDEQVSASAAVLAAVQIVGPQQVVDEAFAIDFSAPPHGSRDISKFVDAATRVLHTRWHLWRFRCEPTFRWSPSFTTAWRHTT